MRHFSTELGAPESPLVDNSLEGRYASALFRVAQANKSLNKVWEDLEGFRKLARESPDMKIFLETRTLSNETKQNVLEGLADTNGFNVLTKEYLKMLLSNGRLPLTVKMIDTFENFYRHAKGEITCRVVSSQDLSTSQKAEIETALKKRAGRDKTVLAHFSVDPSIMGGLMIRFGEAVLDFTVANKLERLTSMLKAPA